MNEKMWKMLVRQAYESRAVVGHVGVGEDEEALFVSDSNLQVAVWVFNRCADTITLGGAGEVYFKEES